MDQQQRFGLLRHVLFECLFGSTDLSYHNNLMYYSTQIQRFLLRLTISCVDFTEFTLALEKMPRSWHNLLNLVNFRTFRIAWQLSTSRVLQMKAVDGGIDEISFTPGVIESSTFYSEHRSRYHYIRLEAILV